MAASALYLATAAAPARRGLGRPLFDGLAPPPAYRWVNPPPDLRRSNQAPETALDSIALGPSGSEDAQVATGDGQAVAGFPPDSFPAHPPERSVAVAIRALDPSRLAPFPPGLAPQGNAYSIDASYSQTGAQAGIARPARIILRYPIDASQILELAAGSASWKGLQTSPARGSMTLFTEAPSLGTFAAAGEAVEKGRPSQTPGWVYLLAAAALSAASGAALLGRRRSRPR